MLERLDSQGEIFAFFWYQGFVKGNSPFFIFSFFLLSDTAQCDGTGSLFVQIYSVFSPSPADNPSSA